MKYVALLRGINVGGNNKVAMPELKACFEKLGFDNVITYINSGNVIFETSGADAPRLVLTCEEAIEKTFGFKVVCSVLSANEFLDAIEHVPSWWNVGSGKHNAIYIIPPKTAQMIMAEVGAPKPEYEKVYAYNQVIFWSAPLETFSRTQYSKMVGANAYRSVTIRNANTTLKLAEICRQTSDLNTSTL